MKHISARYVKFASSADGTFLEQLNTYLRADVRPAVIAVQHIAFLYSDREAVLADQPTGAQYLITFGD